MVNKVDRPDARPHEVLDEVFDLFVELGATTSSSTSRSCTAPAATAGPRTSSGDESRRSRAAVRQMILEHVPAPPADERTPRCSFQAATLDHDDFLGRIAIGRVARGSPSARWRSASPCATPTAEDPPVRRSRACSATRAWTASRSKRCAPATSPSWPASRSCDRRHAVRPRHGPTRCPRSPSTSRRSRWSSASTTRPSPAREGRYVTSRQVLARLERAALRDVALRSGRHGETSGRLRGQGPRRDAPRRVLIENMRREGFEFAVGKPHVIIKEVDGVRCEPYERATVEVPGVSHAGASSSTSGRRGEMTAHGAARRPDATKSSS